MHANQARSLATNLICECIKTCHGIISSYYILLHTRAYLDHYYCDSQTCHTAQTIQLQKRTEHYLSHLDLVGICMHIVGL
jgi:hypothetical protein